MAFQLYYNDRFPLRMINFVKKYLDLGGMIRVENRTVSQLSKLQIIDCFFPSLFVKILSDTSDEALYDYETCFIKAPRKQGVLSNWGTYKQKINNLEDCLLGNSKTEGTYKNHTAAQNMLRRASSDLVSHDEQFRQIVSNLQMIYEKQLDRNQKAEMDEWLGTVIRNSSDPETVRFCTSDRSDGLSFDRKTYDALLERAAALYHAGDFRNCWAWLTLGSLFGNYISKLLNKYDGEFTPSFSNDHLYAPYRLLSTPSPIIKPFFCGRDDDLKQIAQMFSSGSRVLFLYGIGGIGKTEIAKQYASVYQDRYDVIIYALYESSLKDLVIADTPFETRPAVQRLKANGSQETDDAFFKRKMDIIRKASDQRTLIILDNFNTERDECLPELLKGRYHLLVTTQYDYSLNYDALKIREIDDMDSLISIFMNHYRGYNVEADDPDLVRLIRSANCHTYTIVLLAHHMENSGQSAAEMLEALNQKGIVSLNEKVAMEDGEADEVYQNLIRMFSVFDFTEEEQRVLQLLSLLPLSGVPAMIFRTWAGLTSTKILIRLERRGWIIRNTGGITLHPVVQKVIQHVLPADTSRIRPFLDRVAETLANENSWHYTRAEKELYCTAARSLLSAVGPINDDTVRFCQSAAVLFGYSGYPVQAMELGKQLYRYRAENDGPDAFETARAAYRIGWTYLFNPHLDNALKNAEEWLTRAEGLFENTELDTTAGKAMYCGLLENLSKAYSAEYGLSGREEDLKKAAEYAQRSVDLGREWLADYKETKKSPAGSLLRLADVCMSSGAYEKAEELIDEAYQILVSIYGEEDADILRASSRRAEVMYHLGRYEECLEETENNLAQYRRYYGDDNPSCFEQMVLKYRSCLKLGLMEAASEARQEALRMGQKFYPAGSPILQELGEE